MQTFEALASKKWWAEGDTPVHQDSRVAYFVDGRAAMLEMCRHFIKARKYIYLANWGLTAGLEMVRGDDHASSPADNPDHAALIAELRAEGFQEADIDFWQSHELSVTNVLGYACSKGVEVKALLWDCGDLFAHYSPTEAHTELTAAGVDCILDDSARGLLHHQIESLHQKISVVDGTHAFVGGVDLLVEKGGDFDRWDTPDHSFNTPLRVTPDGTTPHPWHDTHALIEGPAVADVELNFRQRWNTTAERHHLDERFMIPTRPPTQPVSSRSVVQITRTMPEHTYGFLTIEGINQLYANAFHNIERFVYLENQYLWLRAYYGIDISFLGRNSLDMEHNIRELGAALERGAFLTLVLPDHPNVGRAFSDAGIARLRAESPQAAEEGRIQIFTLATSTHSGDTEHYRPIYVHAKVGIVDDVWTTVGSGNLNNRGMRDDTEMNVASLDPIAAHGLRLTLQGEHLGIINSDDSFSVSRLLGQQIQSANEKARATAVLHKLDETLGDPWKALQMMHACAWENLRHFKAKQPMVGHLLPYLTADEAIQQGLRFFEEHGWIEEPTPST